MEVVNMNLCGCGCGKEVIFNKHNNRQMRFISGHNSKIRVKDFNIIYGFINGNKIEVNITKEYIDNKLSIPKICMKYNISHTTLEYRLNKLGIIRTQSEALTG